MALLYWLPLMSDVHNQGLTGATFTNNNVTFGGTGKLGSSAVFNGSNAVIYADGVSVGDAWTACWWAKAAASHNGYMFQLGDAATAQKVQAGMRTSNQGSGTDTFLVMANKTGPIVTVDGMNYLEWNHYALVYDGVDLKIYINGALKYTDVQTRSYYSGTRLSIGNYYTSNFFNGMLQDFRLYDTPLSLREIKEISKGLVLHYPLAMPGAENVLKNSATNFPQLWSGSGEGCTLTTQSGVSVPEWGCNDGLRVYGKSGATSALCLLINGATHGLTVPVHSVSGQKYTPSIYIKNNHSTNLISIAFNGLSSSQAVNAGDVKKVILNATGNDSANIQFTISASGTNKEYDFTFWHPKIELGEVATPWIPATTDSIYTKMGLDDGIEYDVSGFERNGTKSNMTYSSDTARYNTSSVFNKSTSRIIVPDIWNTSVKNPEMTFAFWMKRDDYDDEYNHYMYNDICQIYMQYNDQYASDGWGLRISWKHDTASSSKGNTWATGRTIPADEWHHVCFTTKDGVMKLYIDGIMYPVTNDRSSTGQYIGSYNYGALGYASNNDGVYAYGGKLSDFRIYSTALSAEDVADLYNTSISLSNNGTLLGYEYVET